MRDHEIDRLGTLVDRMVSASERNYQQWLTSAIDNMKAEVDEQTSDAQGVSASEGNEPHNAQEFHL